MVEWIALAIAIVALFRRGPMGPPGPPGADGMDAEAPDPEDVGGYLDD
jgi:hypothetical protein